MPGLNHIHTLTRFKSRPLYMKCEDPKCSSYFLRELCVGKASLCTSCGNEFILDYHSSKLARPQCLLCADTKEARAYRAMQDMMKRMVVFNEPGPTAE